MEFKIFKDLTTFNHEKNIYDEDSSEVIGTEIETLSGGIIYEQDIEKEGLFNVYVKDKDLYIAKDSPSNEAKVLYTEISFSDAASKAKTFMVNSAIRKRTVEEQAKHWKKI